MVTVPDPDHRNVIAQVPFLNDDLGELVAWHDKEGPVVDVRLAPDDAGDKVELRLSPCEARELADQLRDIADVAQRAGWTPAVLADVRQHYLPGASDEQIVARLDELAGRLGESVLGFRPGTISSDAGRMLVAGVGTEVVERAATALDVTIGRLGELRNAVDRLAELRADFDELRRFYRTEGEQQR